MTGGSCHRWTFVEKMRWTVRRGCQALVQLNPAFASGRTIPDLVRAGLLDPRCEGIFRRRQQQGDRGQPITLYRHQEEAIAAAAEGGDYVLTTGTGSGKSLAYFIPIVDAILKQGSPRKISAIVVYPMNALCNSQAGALERFLTWAYPGGRPPVRFARYTGQEKDAEREQIRKDPPDILLTNFMMLELILTRNEDRAIVEAARGLRFLVLDELHTYRGRQGADVAMLVRRVRECLDAPALRCIGTSATLAGAGTHQQRQEEVAKVASLIFGAAVKPGHVIEETLCRVTEGERPTPAALAQALAEEPLPDSYEALRSHPLAVWLELACGIEQDDVGRWVRRRPRRLREVSRDLADESGVAEERCHERLRQLLLQGSTVTNPLDGTPLFGFRLHQFISRGDTLYATPEPDDVRYLTTEGQLYVPDSERSKRLYPLAFCRLCGADFLVVSLQEKDGTQWIEPRQLDDRSSGETRGYLFLDRPGYLDLHDPDVYPDDFPKQALRSYAQRV
ncbi:MAG: DEAD/DEAH box helicase [Chloroflexi bacterium]|nr:DEAD/DEAH box helicase [Chloroflexota bacterium]